MSITKRITPQEASKLLNQCDNNIETLALALWNKGKAATLESGVEKAKQIREHANK